MMSKEKIALIETKEDFEDGTIVGTFQMYEAEKHGAAAIILYTNAYIYDEKTIRATYGAFQSSIPVVTISFKDAEKLKEKAENSANFNINLKVDTEYELEKGTSYNVVAEIEGKTNERIVYSSHLDHFFDGIQDNVSAVATLLGIARAMKESGYKPNKTINFVFSGSHEIGRINSAAPDLLGSWELLDNLKKDWAGKVTANINFEYTAMSLNKLRALTSYEMRESYLDFLRYMPKTVKGFGGVSEDVLLEEYYLFSWSDACTYLMKGVPVFMNDAAYEQIYEETSPYMGRDHTNMDNMDIYCADAHLGCTWWYACLGAYLDNKAIIEADYFGRCNELKLTEDELEFLNKEKINYKAFLCQLDHFEKYGHVAARNIIKYNECTKCNSDQNLHINSLILEIQRLLADGTDGLTTKIPSMIDVPHKIYIEKGILFSQAIEMIKKDGYDAAYEKVLKKIDLVGLEDKFSDELALQMKSWVMGENATWNRDKCKNIIIYQDIVRELLMETYQSNIETIKTVIVDETECLKKVNGLLLDVIFETTAHANRQQMMEWIKGFTALPHRKTGTKEGLMSAEYVKETFKSIGLQDVDIEIAKSVCVDCKQQELTIDGKAVKCFFANGTNRGALTGDFVKKSGEVEIVYLGRGTEADFQNVDVRNKLVLCDVYFKSSHPMELLTWCDGAEIYDPEKKAEKPLKKYDIYAPNDWPYNYQRAMEQGAAGFVGILQNFMDCYYYHEDYIDIVKMDKYMELPAVWISREDGEGLKEELKNAKLKGHLNVHTVYEEKDARIVKGEIRGESEEIIVIHSHHDAVGSGAVQDASGMSVVFALADYFSKLPECLLEKTLMFVATDSHYTDYNGHVGFLENRKNNNDNIVLDFAIEHVAQEMDLDDDYNIILTGEPETRMLYVEDTNGLLELARESIEKYDLEKTVILPVRGKSKGDYTRSDVCSDAYDFNAAGIPVVSMLSAPMYLFHNTDSIDKIHEPSLDKILQTYAHMIVQSFYIF